jgi:hypothetical protein
MCISRTFFRKIYTIFTYTYTQNSTHLKKSCNRRNLTYIRLNFFFYWCQARGSLDISIKNNIKVLVRIIMITEHVSFIGSCLWTTEFWKCRLNCRPDFSNIPSLSEMLTTQLTSPRTRIHNNNAESWSIPYYVSFCNYNHKFSRECFLVLIA